MRVVERDHTDGFTDLLNKLMSDFVIVCATLRSELATGYIRGKDQRRIEEVGYSCLVRTGNFLGRLARNTGYSSSKIGCRANILLEPES